MSDSDPISRLNAALEGRYRIESKLGEGGMATVYLAREVKHDRDVAIKVLKPEIAEAIGADRFLNEIRVTARLHHPHILPLHDSGDEEGFLYYVMPFVEGEALDDRIARGGPLPLDEALEITIEVASALSYAHDHGIVHRDIKPGNILLESGKAVVADFGVAQVADSEVSTKLTSAGMTLGTPLYMSPEQASGDSGVDGRSDIYALGCVLYEMLTGEPPYTGASPQIIAVKRITDPIPSVRRFRQAVPTDVEQALFRALQTTPADRFQTAALFAETLSVAQSRHRAGISGEDMAPGAGLTPHTPMSTPVADRGSGNAVSGEHRSSLPRWTRPLALVAVASVLLSAGSALRSRVSAWMVAGETLGEPTFAQVTRAPGAELFPTLSANGSTVFFMRDGDIHVRDLSDGSERSLTDNPDQNNTQPALSPDGLRIAFRSDRDGGGIFLLEIESRDVTRLANFGHNPAWSPDGMRVLFAYEGISDPTTRRGLSNLFAVDVATGRQTQLGDMDAVQPSWSPSGARIAYWSVMRDGQLTSQRDVWTVAADGTDPVMVTDDASVDWNPVWSADGKFLLFSSDRGGSMNVWSIRVDEQTGEPLGEPRPVTRGGTASQQHIAVASGGAAAVFVERLTTANIWRVAFDPIRGVTVGSPEPITEGSNMAIEPSVSPDGAEVTFFSLDEPMEIHVVRSDGSGMRRITEGSGSSRSPQWSPDGSRIAFHSDRDGHYQIWQADPQGNELTRLSSSSAMAIYPFWAPDSRRVGFVELGRGISAVDTEDLRAGAQTIVSGDVMVRPQWSPDGSRIAGVMVPAAGGTGIVVHETESASMVTISRFGDAPQWLPDSRRLVFVSGPRLYLADIETQEVTEILSVGRDQAGLGSLTVDGRWIYFSRTVTESDLWSIEWR